MAKHDLALRRYVRAEDLRACFARDNQPRTHLFRHRTVLVVDTYANPTSDRNDWDWIDLLAALLCGEARLVSQESMALEDV